MSEKTKYPDLTPTQFEYELRDQRRMAYGEYLHFVKERKQRQAAFQQAQSKRCTFSRRLHAIMQYFRERHDDNVERELQNEITLNCRIQ